MREKFQQRKMASGVVETSTKSPAGVTGSAASSKQNLSTSFSAMNNSL